MKVSTLSYACGKTTEILLGKEEFKMKKFLSVLLAVAMMATLAGCGSKKQEAAAGAEKVDTNTVAVGAIVLARDDIPEDEIYTLTSTIFENLKAITEQHAKGAELSLEYAASMTSVPYHPGAAKYFKEKGIEVASVKEGAGKGSARPLTFGTGGESGTYYAFGGVLGAYVSNNTDVKITTVSSGGSAANIDDLAADNVQIAFCQSDVMSYAYNGERLFEGKAETGFCVVAALYMEAVQIVTTNPSIKTVADLKGKKVSVGAAGSGTYFNAIDALEIYGLKESDISPVYQSFGDSTESLKDGKIDAAFVVAGAPNTSIVDLATATSVYLVGFDKEHADSLLAASPYYSNYVVPAGTY